jgi:UDP-N-acetylmuramoylalanine--D-glutamate ligase
MQLKELTKERLKDKKVVVVGLARSGVGAANLLSALGAEVCVTDMKPREALKISIKKLLPSVKIVTGEHPAEIFNTSDLIVVSPGVPLNIPSIAEARKNGIPVIGELELAYQIVTSYKLKVASKKQKTNTSPAFIAITGTNGKSTTTTLVDVMLKKSGFKTILGGNIGNALTEEIYKIVTSRNQKPDSSLVTGHWLPDFIVTEVSSFQLEAIEKFRPFISVILNITPDHLNRYSSMPEYINAKAAVFKNQGSDDYLILNADDPEIKKVESEKLKVKSKKPSIFYFSREKEVNGIYCKDGRLFCKSLPAQRTAPPAFLRKQEGGAVSSPSELIAVDEIKIKGVHNIENAMASSLIALISGCKEEAVRSVLRDFPGLEHRLEFVCEIRGIKFINDSKGTNIGAVAKSLEGLQNVILIMGGRDKDSDFAVLKDLVKQKVKTLVLLGEAKDKIAKALGNAADTVFANDIREAVRLSLSKAYDGDVVLLSPGCASFDMFVDFEDRGRKFKEAVNQIKEHRLQIADKKN